MTSTELLAAVRGHEGSYAADTLGNIHSLPRRVRCCPHGVEGRAGGTRLVGGRIRCPKRRSEGDRWRIRLSGNNVHKDYDLATVVLTAWTGPAPTPEHYARHRDGDRSNNRLENLYWSVRDEALAAACSHMKVL